VQVANRLTIKIATAALIRTDNLLLGMGILF
jgi:hypothetical protein